MTRTGEREICSVSGRLPDNPGELARMLVDIGNCKVKPSIRVQLYASPIVNLLSLFKISVSLK